MNSLENKKVSDKIKERGFSLISNLLDYKSLDEILTVLDVSSLKTKGSYQSYAPVFFSQYISKIIKFEFRKIKESIILKKLAKKLNFKDIADEFFNGESELQMIDSYFSKISSENIITWHNDIGYKETADKKKNEIILKNFFETSEATLYNKKSSSSPRGLKFFIYLTDVQSNNGALAVIPFSNQIIKAITLLILEKKIQVTDYWSLEKLRELILKKENKELLIKKLNDKIINSFLEETKFIKEKKDTSKFDLEMNKGSVIIFDEMCIHRGSAPKKTNRAVLRFIYRKKLN